MKTKTFWIQRGTQGDKWQYKIFAQKPKAWADMVLEAETPTLKVLEKEENKK